jgi:hypothetical protein
MAPVIVIEDDSDDNNDSVMEPSSPAMLGTCANCGISKPPELLRQTTSCQHMWCATCLDDKRVAGSVHKCIPQCNVNIRSIVREAGEQAARQLLYDALDSTEKVLPTALQFMEARGFHGGDTPVTLLNAHGARINFLDFRRLSSANQTSWRFNGTLSGCTSEIDTTGRTAHEAYWHFMRAFDKWHQCPARKCGRVHYGKV